MKVEEKFLIVPIICNVIGIIYFFISPLVSLFIFGISMGMLIFGLLFSRLGYWDLIEKASNEEKHEEN